MARKSSSQLSMGKIGLIIVLVALIGGIFIYMMQKPEKRTRSSVLNTFPVSEYGRLGSSLRDNSYTLYGKVENRDPGMGGELITLLVDADSGTQERLPVIVPASMIRMVNIEREQSYHFEVKVENKGGKGLIIAQNVTQ